MDLTLELDPNLGRRAALEAALRAAVLDGSLRPDAKLPSSRALAHDLNLSRATVVAAYEQLVAEGFFVAHQGRSTQVGQVHVPEPAPPSRNPIGEPQDHDFRPGEPDPTAFPRSEWLKAVRRVLTEADDSVLGYSDPRGRDELRIALAAYLGRTRKVRVQPRSISVVSGFASALGFLGEVFVRHGAGRVAVEDPMLPFHRDILTNSGLELVHIPVDGEGVVVDNLPDGVDAALVTPAHQQPMGVTLSPGRRTALVEWARDTDSWIIEDDYDGEFRYDRRPIAAVHALAPDRVIHAGTASKTLAPGLRIAWLSLPDELVRQVQFQIHIRGGVSAIDQLALADLIERGGFDRQVRAMRNRYRRRRDALCGRLEAEVDWLKVDPNNAGLHLVAHIIDPKIDETEVVASAAERSVALMGLGLFHQSGRAPGNGGVVIGFSRVPEHHFAVAADELLAALRSIA